MKPKRQLHLLVSSGSRLLSRGPQKGFDERFVRGMKKKARQIEKVAEEFAEAVETLARKGNPAAQRAMLQSEMDTLFARSRRAEKPARGSAREMERPSRATGEFLGRTQREMAMHRQAIDAAEAAEVAAVRRRGGASASADELEIKERYALRRAAVADASDLLARLVQHWDDRLNPGKVDEIIGDFADRFADDRLTLMDLRAKFADATGGKGQAKQVVRWKKQAQAIEEEMKDTLRRRFNYQRGEVLKAAFADEGLRKGLSGISVVLDERRSSSIHFYLAVRGAGGGNGTGFKIPLNVDHGGTDFAVAVDRWIATGEVEQLRPVLAGSNMRIVTGMENSVLLTRVKADADRWPDVPEALDIARALGTGAALPAAGVRRDVEALLQRPMTADERDLVDLAASIELK